MAIEIIHKAEIRKNRWAKTLFIICLVVFVILAGSYAYFYITSSNLSEEIDEKKTILAKTPPEKDLEDQLILYETKIDIFSSLLLDHQRILNVFNILEQISHPQVLFSDFIFDSKGKIVNVSGQAASFVVLEQQMMILKETDFFKAINLSDILINEEGRIDFSLRFVFESEVLK